MPHPEKALQEIRRVLKDDGVLIAPTFTPVSYTHLDVYKRQPFVLPAGAPLPVYLLEHMCVMALFALLGLSLIHI